MCLGWDVCVLEEGGGDCSQGILLCEHLLYLASQVFDNNMMYFNLSFWLKYDLVNQKSVLKFKDDWFIKHL